MVLHSRKSFPEELNFVPREGQFGDRGETILEITPPLGLDGRRRCRGWLRLLEASTDRRELPLPTGDEILGPKRGGQFSR